MSLPEHLPPTRLKLSPPRPPKASGLPHPSVAPCSRFSELFIQGEIAPVGDVRHRSPLAWRGDRVYPPPLPVSLPTSFYTRSKADPCLEMLRRRTSCRPSASPNPKFEARPILELPVLIGIKTGYYLPGTSHRGGRANRDVYDESRVGSSGIEPQEARFLSSQHPYHPSSHARGRATLEVTYPTRNLPSWRFKLIGTLTSSPEWEASGSGTRQPDFHLPVRLSRQPCAMARSLGLLYPSLPSSHAGRRTIPVYQPSQPSYEGVVPTRPPIRRGKLP